MRRSSIFLLLCILPSIGYTAETIESFSNKLISALEQQDAKVFESLIYPGSLEADPEKSRKKITLILQQKPPSAYPSHQVSVIDIAEYKDYDSETNSINLFGNKRAKFAIKLEKQYSIFVSEGDQTKEGKWTTPLMTQVLSKYQGHWYMVWPTAID
jgi:hypothetical protein